MKKIIATLLFLGIPSNVLSADLTCWDRNINAIQGAFTSRAAAESWFPEYVYLTDDTVQWGISADSWYKPMYNENGSYKNAQSFFQGKIFKYLNFFCKNKHFSYVLFVIEICFIPDF